MIQFNVGQFPEIDVRNLQRQSRIEGERKQKSKEQEIHLLENMNCGPIWLELDERRVDHGGKGSQIPLVDVVVNILRKMNGKGKHPFKFKGFFFFVKSRSIQIQPSAMYQFGVSNFPKTKQY